MNVSPNILNKNKNFQKLGLGFVEERALITMILLSSCHWITLVSLRLRKRKPEINTNSELSQNRTEIQIMHFKTTVNWLFNGI